VIGDDREACRLLNTVDSANACVIGVAEVCEPRGPFAESELERRHRRQRRTDPKDLQQFAGGPVGSYNACTEAIGKQRRFSSVV
jgi:hypothetical protein